MSIASRPATSCPSRGAGLGIAAALLAAVVWGGALAMTRLGVAGPGRLGPADIALLRFTAPALLLLPVLLRALPRLRQVSPWLLAALLAGGGAPFVLVAGAGLRHAGAAEAGALLPGTVPLCVAVVSVLFGERLGLRRLAGLALIAAAVLAVAGPSALDGFAEAGTGHMLLLAAALLASLYTVGLRRAGIGAWEAAAFVSAGSVLALVPLYLLAGPALPAAPWDMLALQALFQGGASGLLAPVAFALAVTRLGAARAAAFGGLSPGIAALFGFALLGETPALLPVVAVLAAGLGVALVNWQPRAAAATT
ncbi:EamA family transporter [Teichococcus coralli]|nr:EamA family transporter [Pseudoroseomonas coralli]